MPKKIEDMKKAAFRVVDVARTANDFEMVTPGSTDLGTGTRPLPCALAGIYHVGLPSDPFATVGDAMRDAERQGYCRVEVRVRREEFGTHAPELAIVTMPTVVRGLSGSRRIGTSFRNPDGHDLRIEDIRIIDPPVWGIFQRHGRLTLSNVGVHRITIPDGPTRATWGVGIDFGGAGAVGRWNDLRVSECPRGGIRLRDNAWVAGGPIFIYENRTVLPPDTLVSPEAALNAPGALDIRDGASLAADLYVTDNELYGISLHRNARLAMVGSRVSGTHLGRLAGTTLPGSAGPGRLATMNILVVASELSCNSFEIDGASPTFGGRRTDVGIALKPRRAVLFDGVVRDCGICIVIDGEIALEDALDDVAVEYRCDDNLASDTLPTPMPVLPTM